MGLKAKYVLRTNLSDTKPVFNPKPNKIVNR